MPILHDDLDRRIAGSPDRRIVGLAVPALGTLAVEPIYVLVDTAVVGRIGTEQLAGLAIAATILLTVVSLMTFLEYGVTPSVAYEHGAGGVDDEEAVRVGGISVRLSMWFAVLLAVLLGVTSPALP